jgi:hypothetical protein
MFIQSKIVMKKFTRIKKTIIIFGLLAVINLFALPIAMAQEKAPAQSTADRCKAYKQQFEITGGVNIIPTTNLFCSGTQAALWVIKILLGFSGTVAVVFLVFGGYLYLTSGGNEEQVEQGKKVLINSIIGLVVIILSTAIVTIVSSTLSLQ